MQSVYVLRERQQALDVCRRIGEQWKRAADNDKPLVVLIETLERTRTIEQNKRYWALLGEIADAAIVEGKRFEPDIWHEHFKAKFIGMEEIVMPDGEIRQRPISTTSQTVKQFAEYITRVEVYAATELNLEIA